jgi:hypothetical protein
MPPLGEALHHKVQGEVNLRLRHQATPYTAGGNFPKLRGGVYTRSFPAFQPGRIPGEAADR